MFNVQHDMCDNMNAYAHTGMNKLHGIYGIHYPLLIKGCARGHTRNTYRCSGGSASAERAVEHVHASAARRLALFVL